MNRIRLATTWLLWVLAALAARAALDPFDASPAWPVAAELRLVPASPASGVLRYLMVEERLGLPRSNELVRVAVFLHSDEPANPQSWVVYAAEDTARAHPLLHQADDLRRDDTGRITRFHLYFPVSLGPWERRRFVLASGTNPVASEPVVPARRSGDQVTFAGNDLAVTFDVAGPRAGAITGLSPRGLTVALPDGMLAPHLNLVRQDSGVATLRSTEVDFADPDALEVRDLRWGTGPWFGKLTVRVGPRNLPDSAEFTYRIPKNGAVLVQTQRLAPDEEGTAEVVGATNNRLLEGRLLLGPGTAAPVVVPVPAGLRRLTRWTNGQYNNALVDPAGGGSILAVPYVQTGPEGASVAADGTVAFSGPGVFRRTSDANSSTLRAFWGETRFVFSTAVTEDALWEVGRRQFQPLVAIVDEPSVGPAEFRALMPAVAERFWAIQNWGRSRLQTGSIHWLGRNRAGFDQQLGGTPAPAGATTDPYNITYTMGVAPLFARFVTTTPKLTDFCLTIATASRAANARVDAYGFPYINCFGTAFNMQTGTLGLGLWGGVQRADASLARFCRDATHPLSVLGLYGRGQHPYAGVLGSPQQTDLVYQANSDLELRAIELTSNEDLWLHPMQLTRYFDSVDVTADLQHRPFAGSTRRSWSRANFFRCQSHDHRWEEWDCAPFSGMFAHAGDGGTVGCSEGAYWLRYAGAGTINWARLMWFVEADLMLEFGLQSYQPVVGPPLPALPSVVRGASGNTLAWPPVNGAGVVGYRIYRATRMGGPWKLLNSPYTQPPIGPVVATNWVDSQGGPTDVYLVTAIDQAGRESRWFPEEPAAEPGTDAAGLVAQPWSATATVGKTASFSVVAAGGGNLSYQWYRGGVAVAGATAATFTIPAAAATDAGIYDVVVSGGLETVSRPVILGLLPAAGQRSAGAVTTKPEWQGLQHPNGNVYDQFLLSGAAGSINASAGRIARVSFLDLQNNIVQVEMAGAGAVTVVLDAARGPLAPALYNQPGILYMQGGATVVLAGADATTHLSVYSVGRNTNPAVTRPDVTYNAWANLRVVAVLSADGHLGGLHLGNASFASSTGYAGLFAPEVTALAQPPAVLHDVAAGSTAAAFLAFAPAAAVPVTIAGGTLAQPNLEGVSVAGVAKLRMEAGLGSSGQPAPARAVQGRLIDAAGVDVTAAIVVGP